MRVQTLDDKLTEAFDRGLREGTESLTPDECDLFLTQDFIIEFEMNGLSGYFYNRLPDLEIIAHAALAMRHLGAYELSSLVSEAIKLFKNYKEPSAVATWNEVIKEYDPHGVLQAIETRIYELPRYGLPGD